MAVPPNTKEMIQQGLDALPRDPKAVRQRVEALENILERSLVLPGVKLPIGLDTIIGLVPIIGDVITAIMGLYMVWEARNLGLSRFQIARMIGNIGVDTLVGSVPVAGDFFDLFWRSNTKNLRIIKRHLDKHHPGDIIIEG